MGKAQRTALAAVVAWLVWLLGGAVPAAACSCKAATVADHIAEAGLIARATVLTVARPSAGESSASTVYVLRPDVVWKGPVASGYAVGSASGGASCGLEGIAEGDTVVLFATASGGSAGSAGSAGPPWTASLCGGTSLVTPQLVQEITAALGSGTPVPSPPGSGAPGPGASGTPSASGTPGASGTASTAPSPAMLHPAARDRGASPLAVAGLAALTLLAGGLVYWFLWRDPRG